ncbi:MAG: hypothetical protein QOK42_2447 [Frankiaceae bacterium]|jgi:hypothetical protein|nr:hypothetical protein [Frankiaceae bacterium]MDX6273306.1 hypothetical protein [Frankiales bacterium]
MRKTILAALGFALLGALATAPAASADTRHCYTLGVPGQDHYEYCTYLPVDPDDILR